jgi:hypothetical protein
MCVCGTWCLTNLQIEVVWEQVVKGQIMWMQEKEVTGAEEIT